jgi:hypothetical protein
MCVIIYSAQQVDIEKKKREREKEMRERERKKERERVLLQFTALSTTILDVPSCWDAFFALLACVGVHNMRDDDETHVGQEGKAEPKNF